MNKIPLICALVAGITASAGTPAQACGEGQFNMGQGMRYQGYLAPRPATVLVYADAGSDQDQKDQVKLYRGLEQAGHRVTIVRDAHALSEAMAEKRFDVVIARLAEADTVERLDSSGAKPRLLPVVARNARNAPQLRSRFNLFLVDGASLGQYLKAINAAVVPAP